MAAIISFLIAMAPFIPALLSVAAFFLKMFGSSEKTLQEYQDMIQRLKDDGRISIETHDAHLKNKQDILTQIEKDKAAKAAAAAETKNAGGAIVPDENKQG